MSIHLHKTFVFLVNAIIIGIIVFFVINSDSDKSPLVFMFYYPALLLVNLLIAIVLSIRRLPGAKIYRQSVIGMLLLMIPLILLISLY